MAPRRSLHACAAVALIASACFHDDFDARLRRGCSSAQECRDLVADGDARLSECLQFLRGNRIAYDLRRINGRCRDEYDDDVSALEAATRWDRAARGRPEVTGAVMPGAVPTAIQEPDSRPGTGGLPP